MLHHIAYTDKFTQLVYDIQTSYKDAVYSVKLKMEFTILNQLMELVKGNLRDSNISQHTYPTPGPYARSTNGAIASGMRSTNRYSNTPGLGHTAGAYSRMDDKMELDGIKLQSLKATDVLKTTTTEVRVDRIDKIEEGECPESPECKEVSSAASSEVYIIEKNRV
jgi:hypothetical protein